MASSYEYWATEGTPQRWQESDYLLPSVPALGLLHEGPIRQAYEWDT